MVVIYVTTVIYVIPYIKFLISGNQSTVTLEKQWQILSFERIVYSETLGSVFMTDSYLLVASVYLWMSKSWWVTRRFYFQSWRKDPLAFTMLINSPAHSNTAFTLSLYSGKEGSPACKSQEIKHMTTDNVYGQIKAHLWIPKWWISLQKNAHDFETE